MKLATCGWGKYRFKTYISINIFMTPKNLRSLGHKFMNWARRSTSFIVNCPTSSQYDSYFSCRLYSHDVYFEQISVDYIDLHFDLNLKTLTIQITVPEY